MEEETEVAEGKGMKKNKMKEKIVVMDNVSMIL